MVTIYVLKLKQNKYYVGKTTQPTFRLNDHFVGGGAAWTKIYKPISIYELIPDRPDSDEQIVTQEYMKKYGIDNVRGGPWCKISLTKYEKDMILQINKGNSDECYKCGSVQHFASQCNKKKTQYKSKKTHTVCERCGRTSHTTNRCYATTDVNGFDIDSTEDEFSEYDTEDEFSEYDTEDEFSEYDIVCYRCGRSGHTRPNCYALTHAKGYSF